MPIPQQLAPPIRLLCGPVPSDVEPTALAAMRRPMLGRLDPPSHAVLDEGGVRGPSFEGSHRDAPSIVRIAVSPIPDTSSRASRLGRRAAAGAAASGTR